MTLSPNAFDLCFASNASAKPLTLAETLPARRVHQAGKSTNPDPALHISVTHLWLAIPQKWNVD
jgi:hypothetical protein